MIDFTEYDLQILYSSLIDKREDLINHKSWLHTEAGQKMPAAYTAINQIDIEILNIRQLEIKFLEHFMKGLSNNGQGENV